MASYHELTGDPYHGLSRRPSFGSRVAGSLLRAVLLVGVPMGALLALYRNDVLYDWARGAGKEAEFVRLERAWLGGPAWGTPRSLAPLLSAPATLGIDAATPAPSEAASAPTPSTTATSAGLPVVSLDSLPAEAAAAPSVAHVARPSGQQPPAAQPAVSRARPVMASAAARVHLEEEAVPEKTKPKAKTVAEARAAKPAAPPARPAADDNPLKAAIRSAVLKD